MPKYRVEIAITKNYSVEVEADDEEAAHDRAVQIQQASVLRYWHGHNPYYDGLASDTNQVDVKEID